MPYDNLLNFNSKKGSFLFIPQKSKTDFLCGLRQGIPIALGYISVSFGFGIAAANAGLSPWIALLISMTNLTSAGQVAGLSIIVTGGSYIEMAIAEFIINLRYSLMSLSLSQKADKSLTVPHRLVTAFGITDETFVVSSLHPGILKASYMLARRHCREHSAAAAVQCPRTGDLRDVFRDHHSAGTEITRDPHRGAGRRRTVLCAAVHSAVRGRILRHLHHSLRRDRSCRRCRMLSAQTGSHRGRGQRMNGHSIFLYIAVMAGVTYLMRMLPFTLFRRKITSRFLQDLLYYIPYAVLSAMAIPASFYATDHPLSAAVGVMIAIVFSFFGRSLLTVSVAGVVGAYLTELLLGIL